jgi:Peptidase family M23/Transglycosylase-like domain
VGVSLKTVGAAVGTLVLPIVVLPLFAGAGNGTITDTPYACGNLAVILDTIRTLESGGNYQAKAPNATASGAYQYIDSTWRHWATTIGVDTGLYPTAQSAPPETQDRVAAANVTDILTTQRGDVTVVPVIWYLPAALDNPDLMDQVPPGNRLTIREYQTRWLTTYNTKLTEAGPITAASCAATTVDGNWALPVPGDLINPDTLDDPHHDYPAWDYLTLQGTPIHAITGGTVISVQHWNGNWWRNGCNTTNPPRGCNTCGNGLTIQTTDGLRHTYCHNTTLLVAVGDTITPGQLIANSGVTGRSGTPHLHLELRINGTRRCPQPLLAAIYHRHPVPDPAALPTGGCSF